MSLSEKQFRILSRLKAGETLLVSRYRPETATFRSLSRDRDGGRLVDRGAKRWLLTPRGDQAVVDQRTKPSLAAVARERDSS
jgi:hypothetical protein